MTKSITKTFAVAAAVALLAFGFAASVDAACYAHTVTLKQGSTGAQVMAMQSVVGATADGKFGPMTKTSVMAFQASKGLTADGVVGPMTGAALAAASCGNNDNGNDDNNNDNGDLEGDNGTIDDMNTLSQYTNEEVGEGEEEVVVAGVEVEASNDGDIMLRSVKVVFDPSGNSSGDSDHLDDYVDRVSVWFDGEEVGSADVDDFSETDDDTYTRTIALDGAIVRAEETEKLLIAVDAAGNLDSGDIDSDSWTVAIESVRYEDGDGVVTTETGEIPTDIDWDAAGDGIGMSFVTFSDAADTELKLSTHEDNPEAGIVVISDAGTTDDVVLLKGELELEGDSDATLDEFPVTFAPVTSTFQSMVSTIRLVIDGEEYTESVPSIAAGATASITFDNLEFDLGAGDTVDFEVVAEIADADDFTAGSTITASVTSTNRGAMDIENEEGDQLAANEKSGTVGGEAQEFRENGISLDLVSVDATKSASDTNNGDTATFTIKFKVAAIGDDVYVSSVASTAGSANNTFAVDYSGTTTVTDVSGVLANNTDSTLTGGLYMVDEGESETFTMTILRSPSDTDDLFRAALTSIKWNTTGSTTSFNSYTSDLDEFKTDYVSLD